MIPGASQTTTSALACPLRARSVRGLAIPRPSQLPPGELVERGRKLPVTLLAGVQVYPCGTRRGVTHPAHHLGQGGASFAGQRVPRVPKIMKVQFTRDPCLSESPRPWPREVATTEL